MRTITILFVSLLCTMASVSSDAQVRGASYSDTLKKINERIRLGHEKDNFEQIAQGYYERALHNFKVHLRNQDVINDLISCASIYRRIRDDFGFYKARLALADFYIREEIFLNEAIEITEEVHKFYKDKEMPFEQAIAISQLGKAYQRKLDYDKAIKYVEQGLKASKELGDIKMELSNRLLITELLGNLGNVEKVVEQGDYILNIEEDLGTQFVTPRVNYLVGSTLLMDDQITKAVAYLKASVSLIDQIDDLSYESNSLLSKAYFALDSIELAYKHLEIANDVTTELYNQEKYAMANQTAARYQSYEKDKEIRELEEDNLQYEFKLTQRTRLFLIISVLLALGALAAYNYYRLQRQRFRMERLLGKQKEEITQQKINELESSLKIENLQSMVLGQEAERTRIAEDLHDSLGGTLSTLKLQYDALQLDHENLSKDSSFQKIMGMIDNACGEVRDIARNLKPITLEKLGLSAALKDLINRYSILGVMEISLHTHKIDGILSQEAKLHVYRIIQELLNNALKHANASEIDVQLNKIDEELIITVEDNGSGFDQINAKHGLGLGNLQSRVNVLRGEMEIDSSPDRGTSVTVYIPLNTAQFELSKS